MSQTEHISVDRANCKVCGCWSRGQRTTFGGSTEICITYAEPQGFSLHWRCFLVILYPLCTVWARWDFLIIEYKLLGNERFHLLLKRGWALQKKGNPMFHFEVIGPVPRPSSLQWSKVESEKSLAGGLCKMSSPYCESARRVGNHRRSFKCQYTQMQFGCAWSSLKYVDEKKKRKASHSHK